MGSGAAAVTDGPAARVNGSAVGSLAIEIQDVQDAAERIRPYAHVTPV